MPRKASPFWFRESGALEYRDLSGDLAAYQTVMWFRKGLVCMQGPWGDTFHSDGRVELSENAARAGVYR